MAESEKHVLSIDQGTSVAKVALIGESGRLAAAASRPIPLITLPGGGCEQNPDAVWKAVKDASREAVVKSGVSAEFIAGVICTSQYSSIVPVDTDGNHLMNMIMHLDHRGAPSNLKQYPDFKKDGPHHVLKWIRLNGLMPLGTGVDSVSHMRYIKFARPDVYERTHAFLEAMDFLTMKFTGRATANQCTALLMLTVDNRKLNVTDYHPKLIEYSQIDREKWPDLVPVDAIVGKVRPDVAEEIGLSPDTQVITGINDTQAGGVASHAFKGNHGGISIGTTGVIVTQVDFKRTDIRHSLVSMPSPIPDTYFVMAESNVAGKVLEYVLTNLIYAKDRFADHSTEEAFAALDEVLASIPAGSDNLIFLPWLTGSLAPVDDSRMRGGFLNIKLDTTREHLARAAVEGVTMNLRWLSEAVEKFTKREFSHFLFYGGAARSNQWGQIMADIMNRPVHELADPEYAVALGGAMLAFQRLGIIAYDDFENLVRIRKVYEPQPENRQAYDELFVQFLETFKKNRPIFRALNT